MNPELKQFKNQAYLNMETYRKNGEGVKTPVWFVLHEGTIYVRTGSDSWKVKRLRNDPRVSIVPSDGRGKPLDDWIMARGDLIEDTAKAEEVNDLFNRKYGMQKRFFDLMGRVRGYDLVTVALTTDGVPEA